jgi:beta-lactamase regulating signal transducer with metallopeptidase domain/poly(3-hydroxybutyrate) depolymerase
VRAWLWWLVALKMLLVGALWWLPATAALPLPSGNDSPAARAASVPLAALRGMGADAAPAPPAGTADGAGSLSAAPRRPRPTPAAWLFLAFIVAGAAALVRIATETRRLSRDLRRGSADLTDTPLGGEARLLAVSLGLAHTPRLRQSPAATAPLVFGLRAPAVVLPPDFSDALSPDERRMALAHELAHVRRGDLWRDLVPLLARALWAALPVLPGLVWREWATAREAACDALALRATRAEPGAYSRVLLKIVRSDAHPTPSGAPAALGATASFYTLRSRLETVRSLTDGPPPAPAALLPVGAALLLGGVLLAPWRPVVVAGPTGPGPAAAPRLAAAAAFPAEEGAEDVADVPGLDVRAGGDPDMRYLLLGAPPQGAPPPPGGHRLLVVLPGGDGSDEFNSWVRRIKKRALGSEYVVAELVAKAWDGRQMGEVVWPTRTNPWPGMRFSTEEFVAAVVRDASARYEIDPRRVFLLGWASGGPAAYAVTLDPDGPVRGSIIAMSVYDRSWLPPLSGARGRAVFLLHPEDAPVAPVSVAERAKKELSGAGADVELVTYPGGYGWGGDVYAYLRRGVRHLEDSQTP